VSAFLRKGRVWLTEAAAELICDGARRAHPHETGGVLVGVLSRDRPWVTAAVEIASAGASGSYYKLPQGARRRAVARLRRGDRRVGYLGEWHSLPDDAGPSSVDIDAMALVGRDPAASCPRPILIIACRVGTGYDLDATQLRGSHLRRVRLVSAGSLPSEIQSKL
jgi:proteasome lid subunit RPN8/RPN11